MSIDLAIYQARNYFKRMAQSFTIEKDKYYTEEDLKNKL